MATAERLDQASGQPQQQALSHEISVGTAIMNKIQETTFTRWCNDVLRRKGVAQQVTNIAKDLGDGSTLVTLVECLSGTQLGISKLNRRATSVAHKLENIEIALAYLQSSGIKLVNISAEDIYSGQFKLVLGLVWRLILRYQFNEAAPPPRSDSVSPAPSGAAAEPAGSAKSKLFAWLREKLKGDPDVKNLTTDWNDGVALCALIDSLSPGSIRDWRTLDRSSAVQNVQRAMQIASARMGIPQVLAPEDMASPRLDELSTMCYLSYFVQFDEQGGITAYEDRLREQERAKYAQASASASESSERESKAKQQLDDAVQEQGKLREELDSAREELKRAREDASSFKEKIEALEGSVVHLQSLLETANERVTTLERSRSRESQRAEDEITSIRLELQAQIDQLAADRDDKSTQLTALKDELKGASEQYQKDATEKESRIQALQSELDQQKSSGASKESELSSSVSAKDSEIAELRRQLEEARARIKELEGELSARQDELEQKSTEMAQMVEKMESLVRLARTKDEAATETEESLRADLRNERAARVQTLSDLEKASAALTDLQKEKQAVQQGLEGKLESANASLKEAETKLVEERGARAHDLEESTIREEELQYTLRTKDVDLSRIQSEVEILRNKQRELLQEVSVKEVELKQKDEELSKVRSALDSLRSEKAQREKEASELECTLRGDLSKESETRQQFQAAQEENEKALVALREQLGTLESNLQHTQEERDSLSSQLAALKESSAHERESSIAARMEEAKKAAEALEACETRLRAQVAAERAQRDEAVSAAARLEGELAALSRSRTAEVAGLHTALETLRQDHGTREHETSNMLDKIRAEESKKALEVEIRLQEQIAAERSAKEQALESGARAQGELSAAVRSKEEEATRLRAELAELSARLSRQQEEMSKENKTMEEKVAQLSAAAETSERKRAAEQEAESRRLAEELAAKEELRKNLDRLAARVAAENDSLVTSVLAAARASGPDAACDLLIKRFQEFNGFASGDEQLLLQVYRGLQGVVHAASDFPSLATWTQALLSLEEESAATEPPVLFYVRLRKLMHEVFVSSLDTKKAEIEAAVVHSMFTNRQGKANGDAHISVQSLLSSVVLVFQKEKFFSELTCQYFDEFVRMIDTVAFDYLMAHHDLCTCSGGLCIKMGVAAIDDWFQNRPVIGNSRNNLRLAKEAANLLIIEKAILLDEETTKITFPSLKSDQIASLMESFQPDQHSPAGIDAAIVAELKKRAKRDREAARS
eukprot:m51a1_g3291 putative b chain structure of the actin-binding domain of human filamin a (1252) ;mRNA; f:275668-280093